MAFKRYDGFRNGAPQKKVDQGITKCPFCGKEPHWLLEIEQGFSKSTMTCMCEKCGAKLYSENEGFSYSDDFRVVDIAKSNINNLKLNGIYHIKTLNSLGNKTQEQIKNEEDNTIEEQTQIIQPQVESVNSNKKVGVIWGSIISAIIFISLMFWIFMPLGGYGQPTKNDWEPVQQSNMQVEELYGYYYVTITGSARNTSSKTMDYVSITFTLYDSNGSVVGNAIDNQATLGAGQTWVYSATGMSSTNRPVRWESTDVTVICY